MALPSFVAVGNLKEVLGTVAAAELVESAMDRAVIECRSNVPADRLVTWAGTMKRILPVPARVDDGGNIVGVDGGPLRLLAQDDGLNIRNLQWQIVITIPSQVVPPAPSGAVHAWWIAAGADGETVDLDTTLPVLATPYKIITQGPPGAPVDHVELDSFGRVVFSVLGTPLADPLEITIVDLTDIDGGDAYSTGILVIDGGDS